MEHKNNTLGKASLHEAQGPITDLLEKLGGKDGQGWLSAFGRFLRKESPWGVVDQIFTIPVDFSQSLEEALEAGHYDSKHADITSEHFPSTRGGTDTLNMRLLYSGHGIDFGEGQYLTTGRLGYGFDKLNEQGLRPAYIEELLAFGATHRELQRQFRIAAFGSIWVKPGVGNFAPRLMGTASLRMITLGWLGYECDDSTRFLVVEK